MTETATTFAWSAATLIAGVLAALPLRCAWRRPDAWRPWLIAGGWSLLVAACILPAFWIGSARGVFLALATLPVGAFLIVLLGMERRAARRRKIRETALDPSDRPSSAWRGWMRALLAGPAGMCAALGVGVAYTVWVPGAPQTRMILGGLLVPVLWGGAMAWTLSDDRILRAAALLAGITAVTFTSAYLKGFA